MAWSGLSYARLLHQLQHGRMQARIWLRIYRVSLPLSGPALLVLILTGGYMAGVTGASKEGWILASYPGDRGGAGDWLWAAVAADEEHQGGAAGRDAALYRQMRCAGARSADRDADSRAAVLLALGIVYLMTAKPALAFMSCCWPRLALA